MKAIATYQRVSKKEQARDSHAFERQGWELDEELAKYPHRDKLKFVDIQSGRRDDRPDFIRLVAAIEAEKIDTLIVTRIDRITRDVESNSRLQKQLQRKGVSVFEIFRGRLIDWSDPTDWEYFVQAGVAGEKESRTISARIIKTFRWRRAQGQIGGGMVGFPYRRNSEGWIEPDPDKWELAIECIKIVVQHRGATMGAIADIRALGLDRTRVWLSNWIRSPLIRGHTPISTFDRNRKKLPMDEWQLFRDSHPSLFADPRLVGMEIKIDRLIQDSQRYKGRSHKSPPRPLSGLIYCGRCGSICHLKSSGGERIYAVCSQRSAKGVGCGGEYGVFDGKRKSVNTAYNVIDTHVILALAQKATELIDIEIKQVPTDKPEDPAIAKLRADIKRLADMNDDDLIGPIAKKQEQLNQLLLLDPAEDFSVQQREEFIRMFASGEVLAFATNEEKRQIYRDWVARIDVDRGNVEVKLLI